MLFCVLFSVQILPLLSEGLVFGLVPNHGTSSCCSGVTSAVRENFVLCQDAAQSHRGHTSMPAQSPICISTGRSHMAQLS